MSTNQQNYVRRGASRWGWAMIFLVAALLVGTIFASGQETGGTAPVNSTDKFLRWAERQFPQLVKPKFAKLELARMLPELNEDPERLNAPFKAGRNIGFRLLITNNSEEKVYLPVGGIYKHTRPQLFKNGKLLPHRRDVISITQVEDAKPEYRTVRYEKVGAKQMLTEVIDLTDWYEPLQPGKYELVARRRFIWGGEWLDSLPITFEVIQ